jgi:hypothetical protein
VGCLAHSGLLRRMALRIARCTPGLVFGVLNHDDMGLQQYPWQHPPDDPSPLIQQRNPQPWGLRPAFPNGRTHCLACQQWVDSGADVLCSCHRRHPGHPREAVLPARIASRSSPTAAQPLAGDELAAGSARWGFAFAGGNND